MSKKSTFVSKIILAIVCAMTFINLNAQFIQISNDLEKLNALNANEQIYAHTDCEVYLPGDTLWFKAYVRSKATLEKSYLSRVLTLLLINDRGKIVHEEKYLISNSQSAGYMKIAGDQEEGRYTLAIYSSWMKNFAPEVIFRKKIEIINEFQEKFRYVPHFNEESYEPGDTVKVIVKCYDNLNKQINNSKFWYDFSIEKKVMEKGTGHTSVNADFPISYVLPEDLEELPRLGLWDGTKTTSFSVPVDINIHVDFFPEGGNCLVNELGYIAYKAVYTTGNPATIKGNIIDEQGNVLTTVISEHDGMGKFIFAPEKDKHYFLDLTHPAGYNNRYKMPEGKNNSWGLEAQSADGRINVKIKNNVENFDTCLFVLSIRGYTHFFRLITSESESVFSIPTLRMPSGIGILTLLDKRRIPLTERLAFVNYSNFVASHMETDRTIYLRRDSVQLTADFSGFNFDLNGGQYSLSVFDADLGVSNQLDEPNIIASNYLSHEVRGTITNPNYYFKNADKEILYHLDLLLMTQGWRSFNYQWIDELPVPGNQDVIQGTTLKSRFGRDPAPTQRELNVYFAGASQTLATDSMGSFSFFPEYTPEHTSPIMVSVKDKKDTEKVILTIEQGKFEQKIKDFIADDSVILSASPSQIYVYEDIENKFKVNASNSIWIDEVIVRKKQVTEVENPEIKLIKSFATTRIPAKGVLETTYEFADVIMTMGFYAVEQYDENTKEMRLFVRYRGTLYPAKFYVDGFDRGYRIMDIRNLYDPSEIKNLFLLAGTEPSLIYNSMVVIYIQSHSGNMYMSNQDEILPHSKVIPGLQLTKTFYSPKYSTERERESQIPDIRKTIHWEPDLSIDEYGRSNIAFYNSDRYTMVKCVLEGMNEEGIPVYAETYYTISTQRE